MTATFTAGLLPRPADPLDDVTVLRADPVQDAAEALRCYLADPGRAERLAAGAEQAALAAGNWATASTARRVRGLVAGHLSDAPAAEGHLLSAVRHAERAADPLRSAEARVDLAYVLARRGRTAAALRQLELADPHLRRADGRLLTMQALVLKTLGRWDEALEVYRRALPAVRRSGDRQALAVLLGNRAVLQLYRGVLDGAERDFTEAGELLDDVGAGLHRAITWHNLGYVAALRGDVPLALARYADAERGYRAHREVPAELLRDRGELLLAAGLAAEARASAEQAVSAAQRRGERAELAEARLRLGQAALLDGDPDTAVDMADAAARAFMRQRRPAWAALARWTVVLGCQASGRRLITADHVLRAAHRLQRSGWAQQSSEARLLAAQLAAAEGRPRTASRQLELVVAGPASGAVWTRPLVWHARALQHLAAGDRAGARRAAARGLHVIEDHRDSLGATDLRASASRRARALAGLGLASALDDGRPATVLAWAERLRAATLLRPPARPPDDRELAQELAELRQLAVESRRAVAEGAPVRPEAARRREALERAVRDRVRTTRSAQPGRAQRSADARALAACLGERVLVEYVVADRALHAVTLVDGRLRVHALGPVAPVARELGSVPFALRRLALQGGAGRSADAARRLLAHVGQVLDGALLGPLADLAGRELVVVPTRPLQLVPWSLLPSCHGRPVSVSPSATSWCAAHSQPARPQAPTLLVAGPGLAHAESEVQALAARHHGSTTLMGADATVEHVLAGMEGAGVVHIAGHSEVRDDNPQFSALTVADGPLTVYDLEGLRVAPDIVILSACESARTAVLEGDELLGLAAALLSLGVRTLVASIVHVSDADTERLMVDLHDGLLAGLPVATSLARAQDSAREHGCGVAGASFVCLGAG